MDKKDNVNDYIRVKSEDGKKLLIVSMIAIILWCTQLTFVMAWVGQTKGQSLASTLSLLVQAEIIIFRISRFGLVRDKVLLRNLKKYNLMPEYENLTEMEKILRLKEEVKKPMLHGARFTNVNITVTDKYVSGLLYGVRTAQPFIIPVDRIEAVNYLYVPKFGAAKYREKMSLELYLKDGYYISLLVGDVDRGSRVERDVIHSLLKVKLLGGEEVQNESRE